MHDIDRTFMESDNETFEFQSEADEVGETGEVIGEDEVERLAAELLAVSSEEELDHFLGGLFKGISRTVGRAIKSPIGRALGGVLKGVAKRALPIAGSALGNLVVPGLGGMIGGKLASAAGSMFGLEVEGLSQEDQQLEVAKQYVRLTADATQKALAAPPNLDPAAVARQAVASAAERFAPGLIGGAQARRGRARSGRWVRKGPVIVLLGV